MSKNKKIEEAKELYKILIETQFKPYYFKIEDCGEHVRIINESIGEWWKQRFLLDDEKQCAYKIMNREQRFTSFSSNDIDWESLKGLSGSSAYFQAQRLSAEYPTFIREFKNGVAEVAWQLNPDGYYYMDEDGFGMTDDQEITNESRCQIPLHRG